MPNTVHGLVVATPLLCGFMLVALVRAQPVSMDAHMSIMLVILAGVLFAIALLEWHIRSMTTRVLHACARAIPGNDARVPALQHSISAIAHATIASHHHGTYADWDGKIVVAVHTLSPFRANVLAHDHSVCILGVATLDAPEQRAFHEALARATDGLSWWQREAFHHRFQERDAYWEATLTPYTAHQRMAQRANR